VDTKTSEQGSVCSFQIYFHYIQARFSMLGNHLRFKIVRLLTVTCVQSVHQRPGIAFTCFLDSKQIIQISENCVVAIGLIFQECIRKLFVTWIDAEKLMSFSESFTNFWDFKWNKSASWEDNFSMMHSFFVVELYPGCEIWVFVNLLFGIFCTSWEFILHNELRCQERWIVYCVWK
jgi:hypothetical protein